MHLPRTPGLRFSDSDKDLGDCIRKQLRDLCWYNALVAFWSSNSGQLDIGIQSERLEMARLGLLDLALWQRVKV